MAVAVKGQHPGGQAARPHAASEEALQRRCAAITTGGIARGGVGAGRGVVEILIAAQGCGEGRVRGEQRGQARLVAEGHGGREAAQEGSGLDRVAALAAVPGADRGEAEGAGDAVAVDELRRDVVATEGGELVQPGLREAEGGRDRPRREDAGEYPPVVDSEVLQWDEACSTHEEEVRVVAKDGESARRLMEALHDLDVGLLLANDHPHAESAQGPHRLPRA
jgi:hypothetical protein